MSYPILKPNYSWWTPNVTSVKRSTITTFNFEDSYTPSGTLTDSWDASLAQDGSIMVYIEGTKLTLAGNGSGRIKANPDSSRFMFTVDGSDSFSACTAVNNLPLLDTSEVTTMNRMFRSCNASVMDLSGLDTSNVTDMYQMFGVCKKLPTQSFAHFDTSKVVDMSYMFYQCEKLKTIDFENWDVSNVETFDHFLSHSRVTKADTSNWDVSSCKNFNAMFNDTALTEIDLSKWNFASAEIFSQFFDGSTSLKKVTFPDNIDTSNVYCFEQMFSKCYALEELDLSKFDTRKACCGKPTSSNGSTSGNTGTMFIDCRKLKKITLGENFTFLGDGTTTNSNYIGTLPTPSTTYISNADGNWYGADGNVYAPANVPNLTARTYYAYPISILKPNSSWFTPTVSTIKRATITTINIVDSYTPSTTPTDSWDASSAQDGSIMCYLDGTTLTIAGNGSGGIKANEDASWMFSDINAKDFFKIATTISGLELIDMSGATNANRIFDRCQAVTELNVGGWDLSNATTIDTMFQYCQKLKTVDVANWNLSSCTDIGWLFNGCLEIEYLDVANWDVSKVTNMKCCFQLEQKANQGRPPLTSLDVSKWDTSSCTDMSYMFYGLGHLTELDVSNFDVSKVTTFNHTFCDNYVLPSIDIRNWDVSSCDSFNAMFNDCMSFKTIDLTGWNTSKVIAFSQMFEGCEALEEIVGLETWDTSSGKNFGEMFKYCHNLKELNLSSFDTRNATHTYKHPNSEYGLTNIFGAEMYRLEKVTLGENWTFLGDGGCSNGYFQTPSADYIDGADGNWYTIDGTAYAPADIPNLTYATYYASPIIVSDVIWDRDSKKYMHLAAMRQYHDMYNAETDAKFEALREELGNVEEISIEEIQALFSASV